MSGKTETTHALDTVQAELARLVVRDMKTPLTGLANLLEMADRASVKHFKDEASQFVNEALGATDNLEELVELLLGVRRLLAGEGLPDRHPCDLFKLAGAVATGLSEAAQAAGCAIAVTGEPVVVLCDTDQMSRVIRHLIRVALKTGCRTGGANVQIGRHDGKVRLVVECAASGTGGGCGEAEGLGLTYCRLVAEVHGGTFRLDPIDGKSCRWECVFPEARGMIAEKIAGESLPATEISRRYLGNWGGQSKSFGRLKPGSIVSLGTRHQFGVAVALMSAIPLLAFSYLLGDAMFAHSFDTETLYMMLPCVVALVALGVVLLARHTIEMSALRHTLESMAKGELPITSLNESSEDFMVIQRHLGTVMKHTDDKVKIIEAQSKALIQAEQQRVMAETVGAACHHLGQPATVIRVYLDLMKKVEMSPEMQGMIQECQFAAEEVAQILQRLQGVGKYQTEPYLVALNNGESRSDERILKI